MDRLATVAVLSVTAPCRLRGAGTVGFVDEGGRVCGVEDGGTGEGTGMGVVGECAGDD